MIAVVALLALAVGGVFWLRARYAMITVRGQSMSPAYAHGDRLLVVRRKRCGVGQCVVFADRRREGRNGWILKRVAAAPGDPVPAQVRAAVRDERVPAGQLVVLGDNAAHSTDSRQFGYVAVSRVLGVVLRRL
ncbi:S26 family signal peptidase [Fodinicola acaciae]|uniref:S26 family signal peptidase n=1 Tax=Fodinicola acaciae TaxID=2681555 RepID=UPI001C9E711F|nr:S26 family signal peptidase [Fodinicola acaciae]